MLRPVKITTDFAKLEMFTNNATLPQRKFLTRLRIQRLTTIDRAGCL